MAAAELFRRQGYAGTGLKQVVTEAQAPFGSLYHHFPGGKEALADEVLRTGGAFFLALYQGFVQAAPDYTVAVDDFFAGAAQTLVATGYQDACPIATVAGEVASANETLRLATADVFESWLEEMALDLRRAGAPAARAPAPPGPPPASGRGPSPPARTRRRRPWPGAASRWRWPPPRPRWRSGRRPGSRWRPASARHPRRSRPRPRCSPAPPARTPGTGPGRRRRPCAGPRRPRPPFRPGNGGRETRTGPGPRSPPA